MGRAFEFRKARKLKRWSNISKTFTRLSKEIIISVKENGSDPSNNSKLRALIQNAKAANMPKDNIERAIKKANENKTENYKEVLFEGYGPHGAAILIETATNNNNRTVANIRSYFNKSNGNLGTAGSVEFMFDHICNFRLKSDKIIPEEIELEFIDYGVEDVEVENNEILIYASFNNFGLIQKTLESKKIEIISSSFERIPKNRLYLNSEKLSEVLKLIEKIESDEDVQNVYSNIDLKKN
tara:strand:- start:13993 stop:14712 length:720 start_codon:yes stop_codon:yes gene_type:complete